VIRSWEEKLDYGVVGYNNHFGVARDYHYGVVESAARHRKEHMRFITSAVFLLFISLALTVGTRAQQAETTATASAEWNDNSLIAIQKEGGDPARAGDVKIEFYGHDAFKITSPKGLTVLTDPWQNDSTGAYPKWFLNEFPDLRVDIVISTHAHFDHDAVERPNAQMVLERMVGQYKLGDIEITGLADKHQCDSSSADSRAKTCPPNNEIGFDNAIQIIETGGLRIAVWGDNRAVPDPSLDRYLKNVDVLILPVETVLSRAEADTIIRKYGPRAVIPAHYFLKGLTADSSGLESADGWVSEQEKAHPADVRRVDATELTLDAAALKGSHPKIYYFGNHFSTK
jgi:L-ascorbate metabolism protein UlaG (beta-lactamase superfamily)